jgi:hypothetical protein
VPGETLGLVGLLLCEWVKYSCFLSGTMIA